jgi:hypothetical protein
MLTVQEIKKFIERDEASVEKRRARTGERYYEARHDILDYRIFYVDGNGELKEDTVRSNVKISHAFFTELVDQKSQYLLSGGGPLVKARSGDKVFQTALDGYFGGHFLEELEDLLTHSSMHGWAYMYAYVDETARTRFTFADALHTVEVSAKEAADKAAHMIYYYVAGSGWRKRWQGPGVGRKAGVLLRQSGQRRNIGALILDPDEKPTRARTFCMRTTKTVPGRIRRDSVFPAGQQPQAAQRSGAVKALIDDYDMMACGMSNTLRDVSEGIYVVRGFDGDNLDELITNIKAKKAIGVTPDGGVDVKTIDIPYEARKVKLELDEKNIYRFGFGFNAAQVGDGNITNIVIKSGTRCWT